MHRLIREGAEEGSCGGEGKYSKKAKNSESVTPLTYGGLGGCELDTVAGWSWRIFLWESGQKTRHLHFNNEI